MCPASASDPARRAVPNFSLKLASENKINAKNSWSLSLIDHMSDLVKHDIDDGESGANFQKASSP